MLFQQAPKSPAMTWNANLTELEEEEFWAEAAYINDNFKLACKGQDYVYLCYFIK